MMEKRVKIFYAEDFDHMECLINDFLEETPGKLHEVHYCPFSHPMSDCEALIVYTPEVT